MIRRVLTLLLSCSLAAVGAAQSLAGTVVDTLGAPVGNVAIILSNGAPVGTTDAAGNFLITGLRDRDYTVQVDPHNDFLAAQQFDFTVNGASTLGTLVLQPGVPVTGVVTGPGGLGLLGVNMNAYLPDGTKLFTPHDGSDALGNVNITVPLTPVTVRIVPPVGSNLIPVDTDFSPTAPISMGTVQLKQGYVVTGFVLQNPGPVTGVSGAQIITTDEVTGEEVLQLATTRTTGLGGAFSLLLPFGLFRLDVVPADLTAYAAHQFFGIFVPGVGTTNLGALTIQRSQTLSGTVVGPGGPVVGADIDVYTANGHKLFTPSDNTGPTGVFAIRVPAGTYEVRVDPQPGSGLVGARVGPITVNAALNVGTINLQAGIPLTLTVLDGNAAPVAGANLDLIDPVSGSRPVIVGDTADASGLMTAIVPAGTWNVEVKAPQGSVASTFSATNIPITAPLTLPVTLPLKGAYLDMTGIGPMSIPNGAGQIWITWTFGNLSNVQQNVLLEAVVALPSGQDVVLLPPIPADLPPNFVLPLPLVVPMPPVPAGERGFLQKFTVRFRDPVTNAVLDEAYFEYVPL
ncbi:MAG: carboxypeptidase-like regulatory domain-containing protein [Planctomycetota bacterium]